MNWLLYHCRFRVLPEDDEGAVEEVGGEGRHRRKRPGRCGYDRGGIEPVPPGLHGQLDARNGIAGTENSSHTYMHTYIHGLFFTFTIGFLFNVYVCTVTNCSRDMISICV